VRGPAAECGYKIAMPRWPRNCLLFHIGGKEFLHDFFTIEGYFDFLEGDVEGQNSRVGPHRITLKVLREERR